MLLTGPPTIVEVRALSDLARTAYGASEPAYAIDENGRRWVRKPANKGELLAECVGWGLSKLLGVPTPACGVHLAGSQSSFLSEMIEDVLHWDPARVQEMRRVEDLGAMIALDAIIANGDRNVGNILFRPSPRELDVFSIDLANADVGSPTIFEGLGTDAPEPRQLVPDIPVPLVAAGARECALRAAGLDEDALVERVREACHIAGEPSVQLIRDSLFRRCQAAPAIVDGYLQRIAARP